MLTLTNDRNYLRQLETKELLKLAHEGTSELALVLAERLKKEVADAQDEDLHGDCCTCFG